MDDYRDDPGPNRNNRARGTFRGGFGVQNRTNHNPRPGQRPRNQMNRPQHALFADDMELDGDTVERFRRRNRSAAESRQHGASGRHYPGNPAPPQGNQRSDDRIKHPRKYFLGFKRLEEISNTEPKDTLAKLMESKTAFIELIQMPIERFDMFVVIMKIIAKVSKSSFDDTKSRLLLDICNSNFIGNLKGYLTDLPYPDSKTSNNMYWNTPESFWSDFLEFFECIVTTSPTLALKNRSLFEGASTACLNSLKERHNFELPNESNIKLLQLRERMADYEKNNEGRSTKRQMAEDFAPPEDFRELSIMPTREDLLHHKPYVRPNIVNGGYENVEHYLDVQFRLLREDCFGPLRDGLGQFLKDQTKKRYDNIRVFRNVKFAKPYVSQTRVGSLVQIDVTNNKMFKRTNWANNKRFIYGSLVLFTRDNCKTFISATILDREEKFLMQGLIPVNIIDEGLNLNLYNDDTYTMIESEVYFEPYYHVLKALQDPTFPQNLAMKQYIVDVVPEPRPPSYLIEDTEFTIEIAGARNRLPEDFDDLHDLMDHEEQEIADVKFTVLKDETWPNQDTLSFNGSQYEAFKLSLCHEFAVVQGPPGTGKTYLGIKVAEMLFKNMRQADGCLMLVICYTNHALDQFLEALLGITNSIVRIGGQSRNEAMENINLHKLRRTVSIHGAANKAFFDEKFELKRTICDFQKSLVQLDVLLNGVVKLKHLKGIEQVQYLANYYERATINSDPLFHWLFEHHREYLQYDVSDLLEETTENADAKLVKENRKRTGVLLDDDDNDNAESIAFRKEFSSFSLEGIWTAIKHSVAQHKASQDFQQQQYIEEELRTLNSYRTMFNDMSKNRLQRVNMRINGFTNFGRMSPIDRWSLYFSWIQQRVREAKQEVAEKQANVNKATAIYEESRMMLDMQVLRNVKIVGMTTSGAARLRKLLQAINPPIVIVEEAAEVLEQHIITSLTKGCQHLILIGDHQQLRPSASHMKLAKHFGLEVSLFERMITNGIHSRRLSVQHRMRPEIAALICPHIYPELVNHPSVYDFPDVKGITKNLFFYSHDFKEEKVEENMSRTNHKEADLTLGLAHYLMQQGYEPEDITILAAYKGQMFYMRKEIDKYPYLNGVKITVVDNYQGEESKIILLSLVRNNEENKIGFLGTPNRICVALSRAKHGFYIFGNIDTLKESSELWKKIAGTLEENNSLGTTLTLQCQNHINNMTIIEKVDDFQNVPEGGCLLLCERPLPGCGHTCQLRCHGYDRDHVTRSTRCTRKCERILCILNHVCPKNCNEDCGPCKRKVLKKLPCGHEMQVYCHLEPEDPAVKCLTMLEVTLPDCKHQAKKLCHVDIKGVRCDVNCENRVEKCGHSCLRKCHVKDDPDHVKYLCQKQCAKPKRNCKANLDGDRGDHQCQKKCFDTCDECDVNVVKRRTSCKHMFTAACHLDPDSVPCVKKCARALPCKHFCKKACKDPCGDCKEMVDKTIPGCNHVVKLECRVEPTKGQCTANCELTMSCGHRCKGLCSNECRPAECTEPSQRKVSSPCGHLVSLPCNIANLSTAVITTEMLLAACKVACGATLACTHLCQGTCAGCRRGQLHAPCRQPCNQDNVCSHKCPDPCNQTCPPCKKNCEIRCRHNKCNKKCGEPCTPCEEKCDRACIHGRCTNRCGEVCNRRPCDEPCPRKLKCKCPCRGLCGERCPPVCKKCKPDTFPVDYFGDPFEDTDRLILLQDCGHIMEVESMDSLMMSERDGVKIPCCPFIDPIVCRKPIVNTVRYKDLINSIFKKEINPIKEKVFGTPENIRETNQKLRADLGSYRAKYVTVLHDNVSLRKNFLHLQSVVKTQKKCSKLQLDMELVCLDILDMASECYSSYLKSNSKVLKDELTEQIELICKIFQFNVKKGVLSKISVQQRNDVKLEIRRLNAIVQLAKLLGHEAYAQSKTLPPVSKASETATASVFTHLIFEEDVAMDALKKLEEAMKVAGVVTKQERDLIVRAIGLKAGHWYKCPNGHYYCIGECGGAMQEAKCPECGARIGGQSHRLLADNRHAPEMDGSRFAAWSDQYNNMANFEILN